MGESCHTLHEWANKLPRFTNGFLKEDLPENGIYLVFERGEVAHGVERIVRVGTHTGDDNLGGRIYEHLYKPNKDRSIFRKHIGRCFLAGDPFLKQWNLDLTSKEKLEKHKKAIDFIKQQSTEEVVSRYIAKNLSFAVFEVSERTARLSTEESLLSTITACNECTPSKGWLGLKHQNPRIRKGLWNIQGLDGPTMSVEEISNLILKNRC